MVRGMSLRTCKQKRPNENVVEARGYDQSLREEPFPTPTPRQQAPSLPSGTYLLAVCITESQAKVVLLQEVEVLTDQVEQHLAAAMLLRTEQSLCEAAHTLGWDQELPWALLGQPDSLQVLPRI
jgi:hypothetical protein